MIKDISVLKLFLAVGFLFVFSISSIFAQPKTVFDITKTFAKEINLNPGSVDSYNLWIGEGHLYSFTVGTYIDSEDSIGCSWYRGNDLTLGFYFPNRKQGFVIDAKRSFGAESFTFTAKFDEPVNVVVVPDSQRCKKYQIQLSTTDPSMLTLPNPERISKQDYSVRFSGIFFEKITPPSPDRLVAMFESRFKKEKQLIEQYRATAQKAENSPYGKVLTWLLRDDGIYPYDIAVTSFNKLDFLLSRMDRYTLNRQIFQANRERGEKDIEDKIKKELETLELEVATLVGEINKPSRGFQGNYVRALNLPRTIQVYRQSIEKWRKENEGRGGSPIPRMSQDFSRELDSMIANYNESFPKQVNENEAFMKTRYQDNNWYLKYVNGVDEGKFEFKVYYDIIRRLAKIKIEGESLGLRLECKVIESPLCDFGSRIK